jgi:hypothetical protein
MRRDRGRRRFPDEPFLPGVERIVASVRERLGLEAQREPVASSV